MCKPCNTAKKSNDTLVSNHLAGQNTKYLNQLKSEDLELRKARTGLVGTVTRQARQSRSFGAQGACGHYRQGDQAEHRGQGGDPHPLVEIAPVQVLEQEPGEHDGG